MHVDNPSTCICVNLAVCNQEMRFQQKMPTTVSFQSMSEIIPKYVRNEFFENH